MGRGITRWLENDDPGNTRPYYARIDSIGQNRITFSTDFRINPEIEIRRAEKRVTEHRTAEISKQQGGSGCQVSGVGKQQKVRM
jgi:hypothetical protein